MKQLYLINKNHLNYLIIASIYTLAYILAYKYFLNRNFEYFGYIIKERTIGIWILTFIFTILPIYLYRGYYAISSFISFLIYLVLYIPTILTFTFASTEQTSKIFLIQLAFAIGMCLIFYADRFVFKNAEIHFSQKLPIHIFLLLTILATLFVLFTFRNNLKLVSFQDVYTQRSDNEHIGTDIVSRYIFSWLNAFLIPMCLAYGFSRKKYLYLIVGTLACIIIYMATAAKGTLLMPFFIFSIYLLVLISKPEGITKVLGYAFSILIILLIVIARPNTILFMISSILLMRTISIGGLLNLKYYDFFTTHPNTYFSHLNIVDNLSGYYPYGNQSLGQVVGFHYWGDKMNANANFWATDGIASLGVLGILAISLIFCIFLILFNSLTKDFSKPFIILLSIPLTFSLLNVSFFSTLLSGGGFFLITSLLFLDKEKM